MNVIDLASERNQRKVLVERAAEGADRFIEGLQAAGRQLADLAWKIAAPVRERDDELTQGIYRLVHCRLEHIVAGTVEDVTYAPEFQAMAPQARELAVTAFATRLIALAAANRGSAGTPYQTWAQERP